MNPSQLIADARDGLNVYAESLGHPLHGNVLDIGAHHGSFALAALSDAHEVVCVEASAENYGVLLRNLLNAGALHRLWGRAIPLHAAAYESTRHTIALRKTAGDNSGQYSVEFDERYAVSDRAVPVVSFTTLLAMRSWSYVKIDIEGAEWSLLNQGPDIIQFIMDDVEFLDLELHPLDNADYYAPREVVYQLPEVVEWFRKHGHRVAMLDHHPTRLFVVKGA